MSSNTMSALFRPYCGRAFGSFGIRTLSGRRPIWASAAAGRPVSGQTFGFGVGVGVGGTVGDAARACTTTGVALGEPPATGVAPPAHEPATTAQMNRTTIVCRATITVDNRIGKRREPPVERDHADERDVHREHRGRGAERDAGDLVELLQDREAVEERDEDSGDHAEHGAREGQGAKAEPGPGDPRWDAALERSGVDRPEADQPACLYGERDDEALPEAKECAGRDRGDHREVHHVASLGAR